MTEGRHAWNAWDSPYFTAPGERLGPEQQTSLGAVAPPRADVPLADGGARIADRAWAVLMAIAAVVGGAALAGVLLLARFVLSFGSQPDRTEVLVAGSIGGTVAIGGIALSVLTYRHAGRPQRLTYGARLEIDYLGFKEPLVVPRELVRAYAIDDSRALLFTDNNRFPIEGTLPGSVFADALDNYPAGPWDDLDPDRRSRFPSPAVIDEQMSRPATEPDTYRHDDPDREGWAARRRPSAISMIELSREAYLWSAAGSSLPFLRMKPGDVPNVAILFHEPLRAPRPPWWFEISPIFSRRMLFRGGRAVRGLLLRVSDSEAAAAGLDRWGIRRGITAEDVISEGLLVAKPLTGPRAVIYGAVVLGSILIDVFVRALR